MLNAIRQRLALGLRAQVLLLGVGGVAVLAIVYAIGLRTEAKLQDKADTTAAMRAVAQDLGRAILVMRSKILTFYTARSFVPAEDADAAAREVRDRLSDLKTLARASEGSPASAAGNIEARLDEFMITFGEIKAGRTALGLTEEQGLEGELRALVHKVESDLSALGEVNLTVAQLQMRRHEKDFLLRGNAKYETLMKQAVRNFKAGLQFSLLSPDQQKAMADLIDQYQSTFTKLTEEKLALTRLQRELEDRFNAINGRIEDLNANVTAQYSATRAEIQEAREKSQRLMMAIIAGIVLVAALFSYHIGRSISGPLRAMAGAMRKVAAGDLSTEAVVLKRQDELGDISRAFAVFRERMADNARLSAEQQVLRERAEDERRQLMMQLASQLESDVGDAADGVSHASQALRGDAQTVTDVVGKTRGKADAAGGNAQRTALNVQTVAAAAEELAASLGEVFGRVDRSAKIAQRAVSDASATNSGITQLTEAARKIGDVVSLIADIAAQTNLLALNATIEAARAGEAGKGFAVVASEVKALASQTANATEDIRSQVVEIQAIITSVVSAIGTIGTTIGEMDQIAGEIASTVSQQQNATAEIAQNMAEAARLTQQVVEQVSDVDADAGAAGSAASRALDGAEAMAERAAALRAALARFTEQVRAA